MSADDGIYIIISPNKKTGFTEYRVIYTMAIDNLIYYSEKKDKQKINLYIPKGTEVFYSEIEALCFARQLEKEHEFTEYPIQFIKLDIEI